MSLVGEERRTQLWVDLLEEQVLAVESEDCLPAQESS